MINIIPDRTHSINRISDDALSALDTIERLSICTDPRSTRPDCIHDRALRSTRSLLIDRDATPDDELDDPALHFFIRELLLRIDADPYSTQSLSMLALDHSLCPMHFIDYAICFDDDDPDCAAIRARFPNHDT